MPAETKVVLDIEVVETVDPWACMYVDGKMKNGESNRETPDRIGMRRRDCGGARGRTDGAR